MFHSHKYFSVFCSEDMLLKTSPSQHILLLPEPGDGIPFVYHFVSSRYSVGKKSHIEGDQDDDDNIFGKSHSQVHKFLYLFA